jgi:hypothetical protein
MSCRARVSHSRCSFANTGNDPSPAFTDNPFIVNNTAAIRKMDIPVGQSVVQIINRLFDTPYTGPSPPPPPPPSPRPPSPPPPIFSSFWAALINYTDRGDYQANQITYTIDVNLPRSYANTTAKGVSGDPIWTSLASSLSITRSLIKSLDMVTRFSAALSTTCFFPSDAAWLQFIAASKATTPSASTLLDADYATDPDFGGKVLTVTFSNGVPTDLLSFSRSLLQRTILSACWEPINTLDPVLVNLTRWSENPVIPRPTMLASTGWGNQAVTALFTIP